MKVIELSNKIIFVDDIVSIYKENKCGEFSNYTNNYIETKHGNILVGKEDYEKVKEYLLSLNEPIYEELPKEDKKIEKLNINTYDEILDTTLASKINEIIDRLNGEDNESK